MNKPSEKLTKYLSSSDLDAIPRSSREFREGLLTEMKLIDTSWLIELLKKQVYEEGAISIITLIEVLQKHRSQVSEAKLKSFLKMRQHS